MTAVTIADEHMINISQLSNIEKELQEIHKKALSHIIATDLDTLIATVDEVRAEQEVLDQYLAEYKNSLEELLYLNVSYDSFCSPLIVLPKMFEHLHPKNILYHNTENTHYLPYKDTHI